MKNYLTQQSTLIQQFPLSIKILMVCAVGRALCVFTILPFLPIYLHKILILNSEQIGLLLGAGLVLGTLSSIYSGYLIDKVNKFRFIYCMVILMASLFFLFPVIHNIFLVLLFLSMINVMSSSISVASSALFAEFLPPETRSKAFSLRYSLENIGAATGPFLGAWLIHFDICWPFWISGLFTFLVFLVLALSHKNFSPIPRLSEQDSQPLNFSKTLKLLSLDKRLVFFTLGGILSMAIYGPLLTYLSQYLVMVKTSHIAYQTIAYVSAVNASVVICLQYLIGGQIKKEHLMNWVSLGLMAFMISLLILSLSLHLFVWLFAIVLFTIGEIIIVPAEYMYIDFIAPNNLKGTYFGAQNLIYLGVGISPIICGIVLNHLLPYFMFYVLISLTLISWLFYYLGSRKAQFLQNIEIETLM